MTRSIIWSIELLQIKFYVAVHRIYALIAQVSRPVQRTGVISSRAILGGHGYGASGKA
jgi:hypothetical protein